MDKELNFVTKYYRHGSLDIKKAYRATLDKAGRQRRTNLRWIAVAAVVALLIVGGGLVMHYKSVSSVTTFVTENNNRYIALDDGAHVILAPHSSLSYEDDCRRVEMTGKVYFDIRHDENHPFVISDDDYVIRDIGTRLVVDEKQMGEGQKSTKVYVLDGSVCLLSSHSSKGVIVDKDELYQIGTGATRPVMVSSRISSNDMAVWATHEFHFVYAPLSVVLTDLSEYYHVSLSCKETNKHLTADFQATSLDSIKSMIEETLGVEIKQK